ncbi:MAG: transcriptional regulator, partial [Desulfobacula sp.]
MAGQIKSEEDIADYITMVIEDGDAAELAHALGVAARARGMSV